MKKIAVFLADGFEEVEALAPVDVLRRAGIETTIVGAKNQTVYSSRKVKVIADALLAEVDLDSYDGIIIPGGQPGADNLTADDAVINWIQKFNQEGKLLASLCAGPLALNRAGVIKGKKVTCYPGVEKFLLGVDHQDALVVCDGNIITGKGPAAALAFSFAIVDYLGIDSKPIQDGMQYTYLLDTLKG